VTSRFGRFLWRLLGGGDPTDPDRSPDPDAWVELFYGTLSAAGGVEHTMRTARIEARLVDLGHLGPPKDRRSERMAAVEVRAKDLEGARRRVRPRERVRILWDGPQPQEHPMVDVARFVTRREVDEAVMLLSEAGIGVLVTDPVPDREDQRITVAVDVDDVPRAVTLLRERAAVGGPARFVPQELPAVREPGT
jgi:hypothetical protein